MVTKSRRWSEWFLYCHNDLCLPCSNGQFIGTASEPVIVPAVEQVITKGTQTEVDIVQVTPPPTSYAADSSSEQVAGIVLSTVNGENGYTEITTTYEVAEDGIITSSRITKIVDPLTSQLL
ncbi:hypothetical protein NQZ89_01235 [Streptococcus suis]|nr:hypothetical protein NQZ89_01235 [Streptococcus suis]HEL2576459.1 hypothetical protein [Streptococcus suis]